MRRPAFLCRIVFVGDRAFGEREKPVIAPISLDRTPNGSDSSAPARITCAVRAKHTHAEYQLSGPPSISPRVDWFNNRRLLEAIGNIPPEIEAARDVRTARLCLLGKQQMLPATTHCVKRCQLLFIRLSSRHRPLGRAVAGASHPRRAQLRPRPASCGQHSGCLRAPPGRVRGKQAVAVAALARPLVLDDVSGACHGGRIRIAAPLPT
jgi:hypothetical protein